MKVHIYPLLSLTLLASLSATAETPDLLRSVNAEKVQKLSEYNERFLGRNLYFAKRHRIVEVDTSLLLGDNDELSLNLFDDTSIELARTKLIDHSPRGSTTWVGTIVSPRIPESELRVEKDTLLQLNMTKRELYESLLRVELTLVEWNVERATGKASPGSEQRHAFLSPEPLPPEALPVKIGAFRSMGGDLTVYAPVRTEYRIVPLRLTPKYHLVYEVDQNLIFAKPEPHEAGVRVEEAREKARAYEAYIETLPPDADKAIVGDVEDIE